MYEKFTDDARKVMQLANQEAQRFNHEYIDTEHILLGLIKEGSGVAANILKNLDVDLRKIRLEVEKLIQSGPDMVTMGKLPQTPRAKKVIEYSMEEARNLNHNYVGTEHILLGLLREQEGVAAQVLMNLGLKLEEVRDEIRKLFKQKTENDTPTIGELILDDGDVGFGNDEIEASAETSPQPPKSSLVFHAENINPNDLCGFSEAINQLEESLTSESVQNHSIMIKKVEWKDGHLEAIMRFYSQPR